MERGVLVSIPFICDIVQKPPKAVKDKTIGIYHKYFILNDFKYNNPVVISIVDNKIDKYLKLLGSN